MGPIDDMNVIIVRLRSGDRGGEGAPSFGSLLLCNSILHGIAVSQKWLGFGVLWNIRSGNGGGPHSVRCPERSHCSSSFCEESFQPGDHRGIQKTPVCIFVRTHSLKQRKKTEILYCTQMWGHDRFRNLYFFKSKMYYINAQHKRETRFLTFYSKPKILSGTQTFNIKQNGTFIFLLVLTPQREREITKNTTQIFETQSKSPWIL